MKRKIFALHGQPGRGKDFDELKKALEKKSIELIPVDSWNESLINKIKNEERAFILGYSWGAYRLLKSLDVLKGRIHRVVLVSPYLRPENPISGAVGVLVSLPVVGTILMKSYAKKNADDFLKKTFAPEKVPTTAFFEDMREHLKSRAQIWKNAVRAKRFMQNNPLVSIHPDMRGIAFVGDQDQSAPFATQMGILTAYLGLEKEIIKGAGHGILWTHTEHLAERIASLYE